MAAIGAQLLEVHCMPAILRLRPKLTEDTDYRDEANALLNLLWD